LLSSLHIPFCCKKLLTTDFNGWSSCNPLR
jgi:endogenous inhibitor of DNA gyrase (YacG/DUF329 family)